ncbi:YciI family protein [Reyranella sp.]|uniref:YciI family protein n=1 Tax=Reyranella sp. TaxID=1929291 RepID=UPI00272F2339|nr:YciI family protein [Reyranella sp.]MDP2377873.1 YciI family protein [Reyranella sp.]
MAQYMLLLHQAPGNMADLPREKMLEVVKRYSTWSASMREKGKMVGGEKLAAGGVRHIKVKDGKPVASDGPYAEAKDVVGGYFTIEAKDLAEAEAIAKECPHLWNGTNWIELRPVDAMTVEQAKASG